MGKTKFNDLFKAVKNVLKALYNALFGFVLHTFKSLNQKVKSKFPVWRMEEETTEHVHASIKAFKWIVLPASLFYTTLCLLLFGENALDSTLWGVIVFFYSNFLPDLPSIYRKKKIDVKKRDPPWYKRYALLLFAPLFVWILFSGVRFNWKTTETFHNFKSLTVYGIFLFIVGFFAFVKFPVNLGNLIKIVSIPFFGVVGYLTHLKVDKIW
ncbi:MAG: hypothetical protein QW667_06830 [Candidatus Bathyarchaeia archaeon]